MSSATQSIHGPRYPTDNRIFHSTDMFWREMEEIFRKHWILVGTDDQLPAPDSWFVYEDFDRSILVTRNNHGRIQAFRNACRHRGTRLCTAAGSGRIACPYHGWVYDCDGRLRGVTGRQGLPPIEFDEMGLVPLTADLAGRFIFVREVAGARAQSLDDFLGSSAEILESLSGMMHTLVAELRFDVAADWKFCVAGSIEDYHVPYVHGESLEPMRSADSEPQLWDSGHSYASVGVDPGPVVRALATRLLGKEPLPYQNHNHVFPNVIAIHTWTVVSVTSFVPKGPGRTERITRIYDCSMPRKIVNPLGMLQRISRRIIRHKARFAYDEDVDICVEAEQGTKASKGMLRGPAHYTEARVEHLLRCVAERLGYHYETAFPIGSSASQKSQ